MARMTPTKPKCVLYARVSSKAQEAEGFSTPAQLKLLRDYAEKNGLFIASEFSETETAKEAGRDSFDRMVKFFKDEKRKKPEHACSILLVEKTDRLYRNFKDYVTMDELDIEIHLVKENEILSVKSRSHQKLVHGIKVLMAKNYIDNLSEEIQKGMQEKAEQGMYPSYAPLGYVNVRRNDKSNMEPDPVTGPHVQTLFKLYATGQYSLLDLTRKVNAEGLLSRRSGGKVSRSTLAKVLNNTVYYGEFIWKKKRYRGQYEPLVSRELFDRVQETLDEKGNTRKGLGKHEWPFQGLVKCGRCGSSLVAEMKKGKYVYYGCTGRKFNCEEP